MTRPRNTRDEIIPIPAIHGFSLPGAIEAQEAAGGAAMASGDCAVIPTEGYRDEDLTALGFELGAIDPNDALFREAILPFGWKRDGTGHSMHTDILDELGRKRIGIFYKAAWYDRKALLSIVSVHGYVADLLHHDRQLALDDSWATREVVLQALKDLEKHAQESVDLWSTRIEEYAREYERDARAKVVRIGAFRASVGGAA